MKNREYLKMKISFVKIIFLLFVFNLTINSQSKVTAVESVGITVHEMSVALPFYTNVLNFQLVSNDTIQSGEYSALVNINDAAIQIAKLKLGEEQIELIDFISPEGKAYPEDSKSNDLWFQHIAIITNNMDSAYAWLKINDVNNISVEPQRLPDWNKNAGGIKAFYFKDPDGHPLEILEFPSDKGNPKWHKKSNKLFLGIDHTAIAVSNTVESLKYYRDILGMEVGGESENYGIEQERLNNVEGAHLRITGLHPDFGPGIEFLNYIQPKGGRVYTEEVKANDLVHWQTKLFTKDIHSLYSKLINAGFKTYSKIISRIDNKSFGFGSGFLTQDPDGHKLLIMGN
ncbi:MAG: glyoxalase [Ignavibacteriales bacterium CG18_big_fil_WC_8_21_14_2_50_31_20]|nr:MAG: glyoxalase [Ignavibacteriales bacterium CG18_big_fil_WC_8_21_14_2_50_31_20]